MKTILSIFIIVFLSSCSDAFINHSLSAEKTGDCTGQPVPVKMISNINGERYEFQYCLGDQFDKADYSIDRIGDSLLVKFPKPTGKLVSYKLILDVDAKPTYHYITLGEGGQTISVRPAERL
ncbi:MAG: hypothetical protein EOO13_09170 [Chitinophagaceae bacterium]|nr:MAG: hypothetical protein EOO13_09170 [Chitinophagaceae bacterium]